MVMFDSILKRPRSGAGLVYHLLRLASWLIVGGEVRWGEVRKGG